MRIAMWSGPRNLSTAMMYSFAARGDVTVWDEPFYGAFLAETGADHPMRSAVLASQQTDASKVVTDENGFAPTTTPHAYVKLMTHHMLPGFPLDWAEACVNVHLIRHPARVLASYAAKRDTVTLADIGYEQSAALFSRFPGPVIDSSDIRADPEGMLRALCAEIGLSFSASMLHWPAGPKPFDGVWAQHWYAAVHRSTGFSSAEHPLPLVAPEHQALHAAALPFYDAMRDVALSAG